MSHRLTPSRPPPAPAITAPAYLSAAQAAQRLSISRALFFRLARDYDRSAGAVGIGPAYYFTPRAPRWSVAALDRCAARYTRQPATTAAQEPAT